MLKELPDRAETFIAGCQRRRAAKQAIDAVLAAGAVFEQANAFTMAASPRACRRTRIQPALAKRMALPGVIHLAGRENLIGDMLIGSRYRSMPPELAKSLNRNRRA